MNYQMLQHSDPYINYNFNLVICLPRYTFRPSGKYLSELLSMRAETDLQVHEMPSEIPSENIDSICPIAPVQTGLHVLGIRCRTP